MLNYSMSERTRVLVGLTYYYPNTSGLSQYAKILAEELAKRGYQVEVVCGRHRLDLAKKETIEGVVVNRIGGWRLGKGFIMPSFLWRVIKLVAQNDIIHCHLPSVESLWLAGWAKLMGKKLVATYHCYFGNPWFEVIHQLVLWMADAVVVNSIDYLDGYNLLRQWRDKVKEIYPPVRLAKTEKSIKIDWGGNKIVGFLGRMSREKRIEVLLEAIPYLPTNWQIVLAGPEEIGGEEKYRQKIEKLLKKHHRRVSRLGQITEAEKVWFLKRCDCLVLPSNNPLESFGMVTAEALSLGTTVVVNNLPGIRVPVNISQSGELFDGGSRDLAQKIIKTGGMKVGKTKIFDLSAFVEKYQQCLG